MSTNTRRSAILPVLLAFVSASCGDSTGPTSPPPIPPAADLRFKGVGTTDAAHPDIILGFLAGMLTVRGNVRGTPLDIEPCPPPSPGGANCGWQLALFSERVGTPDVNTVYNGAGILSNISADLAALEAGRLIAYGQDVTSVISSLYIDGASNLYATSGYQTSDVHDFDLVSGSLPLSALQAAATQAGAQGRVITALDFNAGSVVYLSYGWAGDRSTTYDANVVLASFGNVASEAKNLASQGYIITAVGGNLGAGYLLVGARVSGQRAPRPLNIVTDSVRLPPPNYAVDKLSSAGYAVVGTVLGHHPGDPHMFSIFIGER